MAIHTVKSFNGLDFQALTSGQRTAHAYLKENWIKSEYISKAGQYRNLFKVREEGGVKDLIVTFSQLFFLRDLDKNSIRLTYDDLGSEKASYGHCAHVDEGTQLFLLLEDSSEVKNVTNMHVALLGTLFHETTHAYLDTFCCDLVSTGGKHETDHCKHKGHMLWLPGSGHTFAWFFLAAGINIALERLFKLGADLAVFRSLLREIAENGPAYGKSEWKLLFETYGWEGVDFLVSNLQDSELKRLGEYIASPETTIKPDVSKVFIAEYRKAKGDGLFKK